MPSPDAVLSDCESQDDYANRDVDEAEHEGIRGSGSVRLNDPGANDQSAGRLEVDDDDGDATSLHSAASQDHELQYPEPAASQELQPPPDFKPFFILIEDEATGEHYHPSVHYVFADDDPAILTAGVLSAIESSQLTESSGHPINDERYFIVDISADGKSVGAATSLSAHWQSLDTTMSRAASWGGDATDADKGLMLKVSGKQSMLNPSTGGMRSIDDLSMQDMMRTFSEKLSALDEVLRSATTEESCLAPTVAASRQE